MFSVGKLFLLLFLICNVSIINAYASEYTIQQRLSITHQIIQEVEAEDRKHAQQYAKFRQQDDQPPSLRRQTSSSGGDPTQFISTVSTVSTGMTAEQRVALKLSERFGGVDGGARILANKGDANYFSEKLTEENTQPMKYFVSMDNFDPKTARKYTTCFNVGDWYYQGSESTAAGPPTKPTCPEEESWNPFDPKFSLPCWGRCQKEHVWDPKWNPAFKAMAINGAKWLENRLRVPKLASKLKLASGPPTHQAWVESKKWTGKEYGSCAADVFYTCKTPVIDSNWCTGDGFPEGTTNILFLT